MIQRAKKIPSLRKMNRKICKRPKCEFFQTYLSYIPQITSKQETRSTRMTVDVKAVEEGQYFVQQFQIMILNDSDVAWWAIAVLSRLSTQNPGNASLKCEPENY